MLRLSDFVAGRKKFYNLSRGLCISVRKKMQEEQIDNTHSSDTSKENLLIFL